MMGINVNRTISFTFALAGALAGAAGSSTCSSSTMRYDTGLRARPDRVHGRRARRDRQPHRRGPRRAHDRPHPGLQRGPRLVTPGSDWTRSIVFGILILILVFRPGHPRRADAGGRVTDASATALRERSRRPEHVRRRGADRRSGSSTRRTSTSLARPAADRRLHPVALGSMVDHDRLHDDGRRPEHRRRLRRACSTSATSRSTRSAPTRRPGSRSQQFDAVDAFHFGSVGIPTDAPGHPPHDLARAAHRRRCSPRSSGIADRPADPAPARRLPGDRHARLRRDHPAGLPQRRQRLRLQPHARHVRDHADRLARLRQRSATTLGLPRQLPAVVRPRAVVLLDGAARCCCSRSSARVRLRDSRLGRAWIAIREDETAAAAMGVPLMRTKTGRTRSARSSAASLAPSTRASRAARSPRTSTSTSRSSCSAWSSSAAWATSGA